MKAILHSGARQDLIEAFDHYQNAQQGLGHGFLHEYEAALSRALERPDAWQIQRTNIRRVLLQRFPYSILYIVEEEQLFVVAVACQHRNPLYWSHRVT